jgi:hypothetical protein
MPGCTKSVLYKGLVYMVLMFLCMYIPISGTGDPDG